MTKTNGNDVTQTGELQNGMVRQGAGSVSWLASAPVGPRIFFNLDAGGGGGAPAPAAIPVSSGAPAATPAPAPAPSAAAPVVDRPEGISDEFWDDTAKTVKFKELTGKLNELSTFKAEQDSRKLQVPESPDKYELRLPANFKMPEGFKLPEGKSVEINADDPRIEKARAYVHATGGTQADFEQLVAIGIEADISERVLFDKAIAEETAKLGNRGTERMSAVKQWLDAQGMQSWSRVTFAAEQVEAVERLMSSFRHDAPGKPGSGRDGKATEISDEAYEKMSPVEKINYARSMTGKK